jgi:hypothetical protein
MIDQITWVIVRAGYAGWKSVYRLIGSRRSPLVDAVAVGLLMILAYGAANAPK